LKLVSLICSIVCGTTSFPNIGQTAFGSLGSNIEAHNLAMGLFMSWFPVLILCSILDQNPMASDDIQRKLNKMVDLVCESLQDGDARNEYILSFEGMPHAQHMAYWVDKIADKAQYVPPPPFAYDR
jgi:hypothetical protein